MKYLMMSLRVSPRFPDSGSNQLVPIIFPDTLVHAVVYNSLRRSMVSSYRDLGVEVSVEIRSAGFISLTELICYGGSETLGVESHPDDSKIIATFDYQGGLV